VAQETSAQLLDAGRAQLAARNLDSARTLLRRVAEAPDRATPDRVQAWVLLGVVGFYASGDSAARYAFRQGLALDPGLQVAAIDRFDPALAELLAAERAALPPGAQQASDASVVHECVGKCPEGVQPPQFTYFPRTEFQDADVRGTTRTRSFLTFQAVIGADGIIEPESVRMSGGTARSAEAEVRRGLAQARFQPGRAAGVPVRTRVMLRFEFEAEGTTWVKYTYRVMAR
jgi:hypothetical protein